MNSRGSGDGKAPASWKRYLPLVALVMAIALVLALDLQHYLTLDALREHRAWLEQAVAARPLQAG
ncbi:MAG: hypothetical protein KDF64_19285, partial [Geminicoccaceae bacterium]|nr:hypothetical protein [Geminicoccaceae bacterium]